MNKLLASVVLATVVSAASIGGASAFAFSPELIAKLNAFKNQGNESVEVGEPFDPFAKTADVRADCAASGGIAKRKIQDNGQLAWICIQ